MPFGWMLPVQMMSKLMVSVSGVRGIVGQSLTPQVIVEYSCAFAKLCRGPNILVARDSRTTGEMVENLVVGALLAMGCRVTKLGKLPTPSTEIMVNSLQADGGVVITASHNPAQWNALKFLDHNGMFLGQEEVDRLLQVLQKREWRFPAWEKMQSTDESSDGVKTHLDRITSLSFLDCQKIQKRKFKGVLDCNHGVGGELGKKLLDQLGCHIIPMALEPTGLFAHGCEPISRNLKDVFNRVKQEKADIGFAVDPDGDRVAIIDETGKAIGEEYTLAIATQFLLERKKGNIAMNLSTSKMAETIAQSFGCSCFRTPVGEINVSLQMKKSGCVIGGEGNGGVMLPEVVLGRDAFVGITLCLNHLLCKEKTVSQIVGTLPQYHMRKDQLSLENVDGERILEKLEEELPPGKRDKQDGLRIDWDDAWVHVRKSNTEPILRLIIESETEHRLQEISKTIQSFVLA